MKELISPWQKTGETLAYRGFRSILRKTFRLPNGNTQDYDIVHGHSFAAIAAFTEDREVILVRQYRPGPETITVGVPAGYIDRGETPIEAARRELLEETGYGCEEIRFLKKIVSAYSHVDKLCFLATGCKRIGEIELDENEFLQTELISLDQFKGWLRDSTNEAFTDIDIAYLALDQLGWL